MVKRARGWKQDSQKCEVTTNQHEMLLVHSRQPVRTASFSDQRDEVTSPASGSLLVAAGSWAAGRCLSSSFSTFKALWLAGCWSTMGTAVSIFLWLHSIKQHNDWCWTVWWKKWIGSNFESSNRVCRVLVTRAVPLQPLTHHAVNGKLDANILDQVSPSVIFTEIKTM